MLDIITFTGIDERTPMTALKEIAERYPKVEFGVLIGDRTGGREVPIFPSFDTVNQLKFSGRDMGFRTAIHLCGTFARMALNWTPERNNDLLEIVKGFDRVQVNLHPDSYSTEIKQGELHQATKRLIQFADAIKPDRVILQHRTSWDSVPTRHPRIEYLYDQSEGRGLDGIDAWPQPSPDLPRMGYAGGIGPDTIQRAMDFVKRYPGPRMWLDMEGRIRTSDWHLDLSAVEAVCKVAFRNQEDQQS